MPVSGRIGRPSHRPTTSTKRVPMRLVAAHHAEAASSASGRVERRRPVGTQQATRDALARSGDSHRNDRWVFLLATWTSFHVIAAGVVLGVELSFFFFGVRGRSCPVDVRRATGPLRRLQMLVGCCRPRDCAPYRGFLRVAGSSLPRRALQQGQSVVCGTRKRTP
jgi:hypothetical protein